MSKAKIQGAIRELSLVWEGKFRTQKLIRKRGHLEMKCKNVELFCNPSFFPFVAM